jgi:hypothetical protein
MPSLINVQTATSVLASSVVPSKPTGTLSGHLLVAVQGSDVGGSANLTTPTGGSTWQLLDDVQFSGSGTGAARTWWKVAGDSEPSTYTFNTLNTGDGVVIVAAIGGAYSQTPVHGSAITGTGGNVDSPSNTPVGPTDLELRFAVGKQFGGASVTWTAPAGYTEQADIQAGSQFVSATLATKLLSSGSASGTQTFVCSTTPGRQAGFTVTITNAGVPRLVVASLQAVQRSATW